MVLSIVLGSVFGILWGVLLVDKYKRVKYEALCKRQQNMMRIVSSAIAKYILLAGTLAILLVKLSINLIVWLISFLIVFWLFVFVALEALHRKNKDGNTNI